jgi:transcriptional regulator with XRE-family HTH domain
MPTLREKLGGAVRRLRTDAGFSQESFADACELHRTYIGSVERGEVNISLDNLERIARTLKVPLSRLFAEAEQGR